METVVGLEGLKHYDKKIKKIGGIIQRNTAYNLDDIVSCNATLLICTKAGTTGASAITVSGNEVTDGGVIWKKFNVKIKEDSSKVGAWQSGKLYEVNDIVVKDGTLYVCIVQNGDSVWSAQKWKSAGGDVSLTFASESDIDGFMGA